MKLCTQQTIGRSESKEEFLMLLLLKPLNAISHLTEELGGGNRAKIKPNLGAGIEWEKSANKTKFVPRKLGK